MKKILLANSNQQEVNELLPILQKGFAAKGIISRGELDEKLEKFDLVVLDSNFTELNGIDFLMSIMKKCYLPVLMIAPEDDPQCAVEAMRSGAYNYIVKSSGYLNILNISIKEAIDKFYEREQLKQTIVELKKEIANLKKKYGCEEETVKKTDNATKKIHTNDPGKSTIVDEIISRFKQGDINLPAIPAIISDFNDTIRKGASLTEIADLLKKDAAISTKLINISNTVYYRGASENKVLEEAIGRLGLGITKQYVYAIANRSIYLTANKDFHNYIEQLWIHSLSVAYASFFAYEVLELELKTDPFTAGLLHDIGKLVLLDIIGELSLHEERFMSMEEPELYSFLRQLHCKFGAVLLKRWKFPQAYINIAMYHNDIDKAEAITKDLLLVNFANNIVISSGYAFVPYKIVDLTDSDSMRFLKCDDTQLEEISNKTKEHLAMFHTMF